jgi:hypothetical protein
VQILSQRISGVNSRPLTLKIPKIMGFIQKKYLKNPQILLFLMSKNFIISALSVAKALSGKVFNPYSGRI